MHAEDDPVALEDEESVKPSGTSLVNANRSPCRDQSPQLSLRRHVRCRTLEYNANRETMSLSCSGQTVHRVGPLMRADSSKFEP